MEFSVACNEGRGKKQAIFESICIKDLQNFSQGKILAVFLLDAMSPRYWNTEKNLGRGGWEAEKQMAVWAAESERRRCLSAGQLQNVPVKECCFHIKDTFLLMPPPESSPCLEGHRQGSLLEVTVCSDLQQLKWNDEWPLLVLYLKKKMTGVTLLREVCFLHKIEKKIKSLFLIFANMIGGNM